MDLINPLHHGRTAEEVAVYKVEPYVVAADVYSVAPHTGRGGWTWYTGSAGWMYRLVVESLLGLSLRTDDRGAWLTLRPCVPITWTAYRVDYRYRGTAYAITIELVDDDRVSIVVDGKPQPGTALALIDDGSSHDVHVLLRRSSPAPGQPLPVAQAPGEPGDARSVGPILPSAPLAELSTR
jgi:cellobiose phosphorylase